MARRRRRRPSSPSSRRHGRRRATRELVRAEILRPEPPLGFVHPLVQAAVYHDLAPGERELSHERAAADSRRVRRPEGAGRRAPARHAASRRGLGGGPPARSRTDRVAKGDPGCGDLVAAPCARRSPSTRVRTTAARARVGRGHDLVAGRRGGAPRRVRDRTRASDRRGQAADGLARTLMFLGAPDEAAAIARRRGRAPAASSGIAPAAGGGRVLSLVFGARRHGERLERLRAIARSIAPTGSVARMLAAARRLGVGRERGPGRATSCALARAALDGGELIRGRSERWPPARSSARARRSRRGRRHLGRPARARPIATGSVFTIGAFSCGVATPSTCAASSARPSRSCGLAGDGRALGHAAQAQWASPSSPSSSSSAAPLGEARALLDRYLPAPRFGPCDPGRRARCGCCWPRGGRGGARIRRRLSGSCGVEASSALRAMAVAQGAGARRLGRHDEAVASGGRGARDRTRLGIARYRRALAPGARHDPARRRDRAARGGVRAARGGASPARAGEGARRAGGGAATSAQADRGPRAAAARARAGRRSRRAPHSWTRSGPRSTPRAPARERLPSMESLALTASERRVADLAADGQTTATSLRPCT